MDVEIKLEEEGQQNDANRIDITCEIVEKVIKILNLSLQPPHISGKAKIGIRLSVVYIRH